MLRIVICSGDKKLQTQLLDFIAWDGDIEDNYITECFDSIEAAKKRIRSGEFGFDLLFLEITEKSVEGLELTEYIREQKIDIDIFFVGASMKYVKEAFRYRVLNYLLKPLEYEMFRYEVKQYLIERNKQNKEFLSVSINGKESILPLNSILYFASNDRKIGAFFADGSQEIWFYGKLNELEQNLQKFNFVRCHQSYLINGKKIDKVEGGYIYAGKKEFTITRKFEENVQKKWEKIKCERYSTIDTIVEKAMGIEDDNATWIADNLTMMESKTEGINDSKYGLLVGIHGSRQNISFRLYHEEEAILGRDSKQCQITINQREISRKHCGVKFNIKEQCYYVCDYSTNGTIVVGMGKLPLNIWVRVAKDSVLQLVNAKCSFLLV